MSEYLRHDFALYTGTATSATTVVPRSTQLSREGYQAVNCNYWNSVILQLTGTWSGTVVIQFSNDGTTWANAATIASTGAVQGTSHTSNGITTCPVFGKYVRVQCTAYTSGTISASLAGTAAYTAYTGSNQMIPATSTSVGASLHHHLISAASTNATSVKASVGVVNSITLSNNGATVAYVKLYDKASAPSVGTDTPVLTVLVPINGTVSVNSGYAGLRFPTGIAYAITGGMAVADVTAVALSQVSVSINYT